MNWESIFSVSLEAIIAPVESNNSSIGSASGLVTPPPEREGPIARSTTCLLSLPVMIMPPIKTLSPVPTFARVEMFCGSEGVETVAGEGSS